MSKYYHATMHIENKYYIKQKNVVWLYMGAERVPNVIQVPELGSLAEF